MLLLKPPAVPARDASSRPRPRHGLLGAHLYLLPSSRCGFSTAVWTLGRGDCWGCQQGPFLWRGGGKPTSPRARDQHWLTAVTLPTLGSELFFLCTVNVVPVTSQSSPATQPVSWWTAHGLGLTRGPESGHSPVDVAWGATPMDGPAAPTPASPGSRLILGWGRWRLEAVLVSSGQTQL